MNKKQVIVLLSAVLLFSLSELFPPWYYEHGETSSKQSAGYHFNAPPVKSAAEMKQIFPFTDGRPNRFSVGRDRLRLLGQRIILTTLMLGLLLLLEERKSVLKTALGVICLSLALAVSAAYGWYVSGL